VLQKTLDGAFAYRGAVSADYQITRWFKLSFIASLLAVNFTASSDVVTRRGQWANGDTLSGTTTIQYADNPPNVGTLVNTTNEGPDVTVITRSDGVSTNVETETYNPATGTYNNNYTYSSTTQKGLPANDLNFMQVALSLAAVFSF
jgi:hypothetical protein